MAQKDTRTLFLSNMVHEISSESISEAFWTGCQVEVASVEVLMRGVPGGAKKACGLATVKFSTDEDCQRALEKMDGYLLYNRPMIVRADKFVADDPNYTHKPQQAAAAADTL